MRRNAAGDAGFSLVEVIFALAILGVVMISISGMFTLATRELNRGRGQTAAVTVARDVIEEMTGWSYRDLWRAFGRDGSATQYVIDSRVDPQSANWQALLDEALGGSDGWIEITVASVTETGSPPALRDSTSVRVVVTVQWQQGLQTRSVQIATVRT
ncbi:MAG: prepilin-type N-terminal cleavage/methylation domain-containing protein [Acidobacteriota bacterium]|nr:prepilin-type N-terminal cleavage/methylation domain-containing protein [Acidobacteriota bacterium]